MKWGEIYTIYFTKGKKEMSITIAIGNDPIHIERLNTLKEILDSQDQSPQIVDLKSWVSDIHKFLTDPSVFINS